MVTVSGGGGGEGVESLHLVCLCILEYNYTSTTRVQPILTINYNTYKLVQYYKDFHGETRSEVCMFC